MTSDRRRNASQDLRRNRSQFDTGNLFVVVTQVQKSVMMDKRQAELLNPTHPTENVSVKGFFSGEVNDRIESITKTLNCHFVAECIEPLAKRGGHGQRFAVFDGEAEFLAMYSLEDAVCGSCI